MKIATHKRDVEALRVIINNKKRLAILKEQMGKLESATEVAADFLKARHPDGLALQTTSRKAKIVEFTTFDRQYVNMSAIKRILHDVPMRTVKVQLVRVVNGRVED